MGEVEAVFFFVDPLSAQPHDPDIRALLRVCIVHNVPLATNLATADIIIAILAPTCRRRAAAQRRWTREKAPRGARRPRVSQNFRGGMAAVAGRQGTTR